MSKTVELHAEIVENDAGDIVMRLKDRKGAITFHRASGGTNAETRNTTHHKCPRAVSGFTT